MQYVCALFMLMNYVYIHVCIADRSCAISQWSQTDRPDTRFEGCTCTCSGAYDWADLKKATNCSTSLSWRCSSCSCCLYDTLALLHQVTWCV